MVRFGNLQEDGILGCFSSKPGRITLDISLLQDYSQLIFVFFHEYAHYLSTHYGIFKKYHSSAWNAHRKNLRAEQTMDLIALMLIYEYEPQIELDLEKCCNYIALK